MVKYLSFRTFALAFLVFGASLFALYSCKETNTVAPATGSTISGTVSEPDGSPLVGVMVRSGDDSVLTDGTGSYRLNNGLIKDGRAVVSFKKDGYFNTVNGTTAMAEGGSVINAVLLKKALLGSFDNAAGGVVTSTNGMTFTFQPNTFNKADGSPYVGKIRIYGAKIDPEDQSFASMMPGGDMMAEDPNNPGKLGIMVSVGAFFIDAAGGEGNRRAGAGSLATASDDSVVAVAPNQPFTFCTTIRQGQVDVINARGLTSLGIWTINPSTGLWKKLIYAVTLNGNTLCTQVKELTACNLDFLDYYTTVIGKVCRPDGSPAGNAPVVLASNPGSYLSTYQTTTNSQGQFRLRFPGQNTPRTYTLYNPFGSATTPPLKVGDEHNFGDYLCETVGGLNGKIYVSVGYDNVLCADSNNYPVVNGWQPTIQTFNNDNIDFTSNSSNCPGTKLRIVANSTGIGVNTYRVYSRSNRFVEVTLPNGKVYSTNPPNIPGSPGLPQSVGGSFTISSYSTRLGNPAVALGSYQFTGAWYNNSTRTWETKVFNGNFRLQVQ